MMQDVYASFIRTYIDISSIEKLNILTFIYVFIEIHTKLYKKKKNIE